MNELTRIVSLLIKSCPLFYFHLSNDFGFYFHSVFCTSSPTRLLKLVFVEKEPYRSRNLNPSQRGTGSLQASSCRCHRSAESISKMDQISRAKRTKHESGACLQTYSQVRK